MKQSDEEKGRWIILSITMLLFVPLVFVIGLIFGLNIQGTVSFSQDTLSAWVTAFATVSIAVLTIVLAKETWALRIIQLNHIDQIRKDAIKPSVDLYLKNSPASFNFFDVHISNSGPGAAQNIHFTFNNGNTDAKNVYEFLLERFHKLAILRSGISSLGSGEKRSSYLFSFIELQQKFLEKSFDCVINIDIAFEDIEGTKYKSKACLNFSEYKGISELGGGDPLYKLSSSLGKIEVTLAGLAKGYAGHKMKVDVYDSTDRENERKALEESYENNGKENELNPDATPDK